VLEKIKTSRFEGNFSSELIIAQMLMVQNTRPNLFQVFRPPNPQNTERTLKLEEKDLRSLANKIADFYLKATRYNTFYRFAEILPDLKKYAPAKAGALEKKETDMKKVMPESMTGYQDALKLFSDPNTSGEALIAEAKKYPGYQKSGFYSMGITKGLQRGEAEKIRQLLKAEPDSKQKTEALNFLNKQLSAKALKDGKLEDARALIDQAQTESAKIIMMVDLAIGFEKKNTEEDHATAVRLIREASDLVNQVPESREEVADILKVASGFAMIDPENAFSYLNNLTFMVNDLMTAYALIAKYDKRSNSFKDGEIIFTQNINPSFSNYGEALGRLAAADFGKTANLIDQFQRSDVKVLAKFLLAQSVINGKIGLEGNRTYSFAYNY
jgi:hypothetical protein